MKLTRLLILCALVLPQPALAQSRSWVFGGEIGLSGAQPISFMEKDWLAEFNGPGQAREPGCWKRTAPYLGLTVGRWLQRAVHVDATAALVAGRGGGCDYTEDVSNRVEGRYTGSSPGPAYLSTQLRAVFEPGTATVRPRVVAGLGWIPRKNVPSFVFGGGFSSGKGAARFVSDFGAQITRIRWTRQFQCFGNCSAYAEPEWFVGGTSTALQPYARVGVEF